MYSGLANRDKRINADHTAPNELTPGTVPSARLIILKHSDEGFRHSHKEGNSLGKSMQGYSLFELMVTVAVAAIVINLAVSGLKPVIDSARTRSSVSAVDQAFRLARQTAVEQAQTVTICALNDDQACGAGWNHPVSVFIDPGNEKKMHNEGQLLRVIQSPGHTRFAARPAHMPYFQYNLMGEIRGATGGHVNICPSNETLAHARIIIGPSGRTRVIWHDPGDRGC